MYHFVKAGFALARRNLPVRRGGLDQHQTRRAARLAHHVEKIADGVRAIGILSAVARIANRLLDLHQLPVGVQLVGDYQSQRDADAVPISERWATI